MAGLPDLCGGIVLTEKFVQDSLQLPFMQIETDYSEKTDTEQLKVRIEAFIEML